MARMAAIRDSSPLIDSISLQRYGAVDSGVDGVIQIEHLAHNNPRNVAHICVGKAQDNVTASGHSERCARNRPLIYESARAQVDLRSSLRHCGHFVDPRRCGFISRGLL